MTLSRVPPRGRVNCGLRHHALSGGGSGTRQGTRGVLPVRRPSVGEEGDPERLADGRLLLAGHAVAGQAHQLRVRHGHRLAQLVEDMWRGLREPVVLELAQVRGRDPGCPGGIDRRQLANLPGSATPNDAKNGIGPGPM